MTERSKTSQSCWVCSSPHSISHKPRAIDRPLKPADLRITDDHYGATLELLRCQTCGFLFADADDVRQLVRLYEQLDDPHYESSQDTRRLQMRWLIKHIRKLRPTAQSLLDIGAGAGLLVAEAQTCGFESVGIEPSQSLVDHAPQINGVDLIQGTFPHRDLANRRFDVITLIDVIEHVSNPVELLSACRAALRPGGLLVVVTPDVGSIAARLLGFRWWHFRLAHVGFFNRRNLGVAAQQAGLRIDRLKRAKWFFRVHYLAQRLEQYLPLRTLNRIGQRFFLTRWVYNLIVPLNLFDSWVAYMDTAPAGSQEHC